MEYVPCLEILWLGHRVHKQGLVEHQGCSHQRVKDNVGLLQQDWLRFRLVGQRGTQVALGRGGKLSIRQPAPNGVCGCLPQFFENRNAVGRQWVLLQKGRQLGLFEGTMNLKAEFFMINRIFAQEFYLYSQGIDS